MSTRTRTTNARLLTVVLVLVASACGSDGSGDAVDAGASDTAATDSAATDAAASDTAASDTAANDTAANDTAANDTAATDTAATDTTAADSADSGSDDAPLSDVAADSDATDTGAEDITVDAGPAATVVGNLVTVGLSFGKCVSANCKTKLELEGASLLLTVSNNKDEPTFMAKGILTTGSAAKLDELVAALAGKAIPLVSGCPGCADGGIASLTFSDGKQSNTHTYESGNPPKALAAIDALMGTAIAGLKACVGDATVVVHTPCPMDLP